MVRWDSPLFTVPWTDPDVPADDIWRAITQGLVKPPNTGTQAVRGTYRFTNNIIYGTHLPLLTLGHVHIQVAKAPTDALHTLESTTAALVAAIVAAQSASPLGGTLLLDVPTSTTTTPLTTRITLPPRHLTFSELQRLKRQFVTIHKRAITLGTTEKGKVDWSEESVAHKFVVYLEGNVGLKL